MGLRSQWSNEVLKNNLNHGMQKVVVYVYEKDYQREIFPDDKVFNSKIKDIFKLPHSTGKIVNIHASNDFFFVDGIMC